MRPTKATDMLGQLTTYGRKVVVGVLKNSNRQGWLDGMYEAAEIAEREGARATANAIKAQIAAQLELWGR